MTRIALVTNSNASLPPELIRRYNIHVTPMPIHFLDGNYEEGSDISMEEFYARLGREEVIPTSSAPSVPRYQRLFDELLVHYDQILSIHIGHQLSRSFENAQTAARSFGGDRIYTHDSRSVSMGTGFQLLTAARLLEQGAGIEAVLAQLERQRDQTLALFAPPTLRYMRNSRRVGPFATLLATLLNIKPVIQVRDGVLTVLERSRSWQAALECELDTLCEFLRGSGPTEVAVCHTNAQAAAEAFAEQIRERLPHVMTLISEAGTVLAVHCGPGALGVMTYRNEA